MKNVIDSFHKNLTEKDVPEKLSMFKKFDGLLTASGRNSLEFLDEVTNGMLSNSNFKSNKII